MMFALFIFCLLEKRWLSVTTVYSILGLIGGYLGDLVYYL